MWSVVAGNNVSDMWRPTVVVDRELFSYLGDARYQIEVLDTEVVVYDLAYSEGLDRFVVHRLYIGKGSMETNGMDTRGHSEV